MQNIEERFQDTDVIESMSVLDLQEQEDIPTFFGDLEMQTLTDYFGLEEETLNLQWQGFLELVKMSSAQRSLNYFTTLLYGNSHAEKDASGVVSTCGTCHGCSRCTTFKHC